MGAGYWVVNDLVVGDGWWVLVGDGIVNDCVESGG